MRSVFLAGAFATGFVVAWVTLSAGWLPVLVGYLLGGVSVTFRYRTWDARGQNLDPRGLVVAGFLLWPVIFASIQTFRARARWRRWRRRDA